MKDIGWTPDPETAYYRAGETTQRGGGVTPSKPESGERFHPLKACGGTAGPPAKHPRPWKRQPGASGF